MNINNQHIWSIIWSLTLISTSEADARIENRDGEPAGKYGTKSTKASPQNKVYCHIISYDITSVILALSLLYHVV